jgi:putative DNA primase/helicase
MSRDPPRRAGVVMSAHDAIADFLGFMESEGIKPVEPISNRLSSGQLIRFRCDGDGKGRQNGWAILYLDERPAGAFGNYRLGIDRKWKSGGDFTPLSHEERQALQREWVEAKQRRIEERQRSENEAALDAVEMWSRASPASAHHPYVVRKRLDAGPLRQLDGKLLVPMIDGSGKLWNLQRIAADGTKRFLYGGRTDGLFCLIGQCSARAETMCIGEGYATMAAVHRSSCYPCIVAFSAKNMAAVARLWNAARPDLNFVICADDDSDNPNGNVGLKAAEAAALEIGAKVAFPVAQTSEAA